MCSSDLAHHIVESIELVVDSAKIEVQIGALGVLADAFFQGPCRIIELVLLEVRQSQHDVGFRLFRINRNGLIQMRDGLRKLLQSIEQQAKMQVPFEEGRLKLHVKRVRLDGLLRVLGLLVEKSKVVSDFELGWTRLENLVQLIDGLGIFLLFPIEDRQSKIGRASCRERVCLAV